MNRIKQNQYSIYCVCSGHSMIHKYYANNTETCLSVGIILLCLSLSFITRFIVLVLWKENHEIPMLLLLLQRAPLQPETYDLRKLMSSSIRDNMCSLILIPTLTSEYQKPLRNHMDKLMTKTKT